MFTLKIYHTDGSYTAVACNKFRVIPSSKDSAKAQVQIWPPDGKDFYFAAVDPRVIVENSTGKTIDIIRPYGSDVNGRGHAN